jgi:BolA family transcriptional regulator, general stress-responsive regulator
MLCAAAAVRGKGDEGDGRHEEGADMSAAQSRAERLRAVLAERFAPSELRVEDDSARHAGHAGARPGGETHYTVTLVSDAFRGQNRVARARAVHEALEAEFGTGLHALALTLRTPEEQERAG